MIKRISLTQKNTWEGGWLKKNQETEHYDMGVFMEDGEAQVQRFKNKMFILKSLGQTVLNFLYFIPVIKHLHIKTLKIKKT